MSFKFVKELIIRSDELVGAMLRLLPGGNLSKTTTIRTTQTDDRIIDTPDASGVISLRTNAEELENKTIDADKNTVTNLSVVEFASGVIATNLNTPNDTSIPTTKAVNDVTSGFQSEIDVIKAHHMSFTLVAEINSTHITNKMVTIPFDTWSINYIKLQDGPVISDTIDADISSTGTQIVINWAGYWLDGVLAENDVIVVSYYETL